MGTLFPKDFKFGWSQAGFQSEMGLPGDEDPNSDWFVWVHDRDNITAGLVSGDLPENGPAYWSLYRAFHDDAVKMGLNAARINIEWSRIFPKGMPRPVESNVNMERDEVIHVDIDGHDLEELDGAVNKAAVDRYRNILEDLKSRGIFIVLNMYHWSLPLWIHDPIRVRNGDLRGPSGWIDARTVVDFARFAGYVSWKFDDLVDMYSTMNEPNVVAWSGYIGIKSGFPPGRLDSSLAKKATSNLIRAHARAYDAIKLMTKKPVGIIYANNSYTPLTEKDAAAVELAERDSRWSFLDAVARDGDRDDLRNRLDWIGVNYYSRLMIRSTGNDSYAVVPGYGHVCNGSISRDGRPCSDFGWEIYPEGIYDVLIKYWSRYGIPIYVTENGIADSLDFWRPHYLVSHIHQVHKAMSEGVDVRGYMHWSLADNYEWASGFKMRFGLLQVDYASKRRLWRPSALIYREIAISKAIPDEFEHLTHVPLGKSFNS
ncbi:beta-galactosidase [Thermocladium modestius]|uniref:Beta-galactosidase n=1 Tax=Thermocladium modestius TaxID=62609 RepID=A0A830GY07_9CREN|nr:beta-galactosidase BgaS [Thermocladium modestius]GGP20579.1 beta-galactosidase [Thermocladium modestius]